MQIGLKMILEIGGLMRGHVEFVVEGVGGDGEDALGAGGLGIDEDGGGVEGEAGGVGGDGVVGGEFELFDAAADLHAVEEDLVVAEEDEAGVPKNGVAVVGGVVFIPGFLREEDGVFVFVGVELGEFGVGGVVDGGKFGEALPFPGSGEELFELVDDVFHRNLICLRCDKCKWNACHGGLRREETRGCGWSAICIGNALFVH